MANYESGTANHGIIACPVVVLCGGLGLRLRPAIQDKPKCLAPIAGRPFLEWLLGGLHRQGCARVILCLGYGSDQVVEFLEKRETLVQRRETRDERQAMHDFPQMEIRYVIEQQTLGTGGALRNAAPLIHEDHFLAMNGDTILDVGLKELLRSHKQRDALATLALRPNPEDAARYGGVQIDVEGRIVRFSEKGVDNDVIRRPSHPPLGGSASTPRGRGTVGKGGSEPPNPNPQPPAAVPGIASTGAGKDAGATFINGGVYAFAKEIFEIIPKAPASVSLEKDVFPSIVRRRFYGFPCDGYFLDIGIPEDYQKAQTELPERLMPW